MGRVIVPRRTDYGLLVVAFSVGCFVCWAGNLLLGERIELFYGLETFNAAWLAQVYLVPFLAGIAISYVYGYGGKWLAHFPPLLVCSIAYWETQYITGIPEGYALVPLGWWAFYVILAMEFCAFGGVIGELLNKRYSYRFF